MSSNINKLYNIWVKNENIIPATYGNVSLYTQAKSDINQITTTSLGIGCNNPSTTYVLDVSGTARVSSNLDVTGNINSSWLDASLNLRALDVDVVHKTGDELIGNIKSFSSQIKCNQIASYNTTNSFSINSTTSNVTFYRHSFRLLNPNNVGRFEYYPEYGTGATQDNIKIYDIVFRSNKIVLTDVGNIDISTTELSYLDGVTSNIQTQFNGCVKLTGDQSISGNKTFAGNVSFNTGSVTFSNALTTTGIICNGDISGSKITASNGAVIYRYAPDIITIGANIGTTSTSSSTFTLKSIMIGNEAGKVLNNGTNTDNIFIGQGAGQAMTSSQYNTLIGVGAGGGLTTNSNYNVAIGSNCFGGSTAGNSNNILIGSNVLGGGTNTNWKNNVILGSNACSGDPQPSCEYCFFLGDNTGSLNTNTTVSRYCVCIGASSYINGNYSYSFALGAETTIDASNTCYIGDATRMPTTILHKQIAPFRSLNSVINAATTLTFPVYAFYSVNAGATAFTITLPTIGVNQLGTKIQFRRVGGTTTTAVSFIGNGTQKVYNTALTGGATSQALMGSGVYIVKLVALVDGTAGTFAWFQI